MKWFDRQLRAYGLLGIVRSDELGMEDVRRSVVVMYEEGMRLIEFSLTMTTALRAIATAVKLDLPGLAVGAGTVLSLSDARSAVEAGASFLVAPNLNIALVDEMTNTGVPFLPGVLTPTEIQSAVDHGLASVKLFPATVAGISTVKALRAPFPKVGLVVTGGVGLGDVAKYLGAGASAVALGGALVESDEEQLRSNVRQAIGAARSILDPSQGQP